MTGCCVRHCLIKLISNISVNFFTKEILGRPDHFLFRNFNLVILIQVQPVCCLVINMSVRKLHFFKRLEIVDDIDNLPGCVKDTGYIGKQEVWHKSSLNDFSGMNVPGDCQNGLSIKLGHWSLTVFPVNREEIEKFSDIRFFLAGIFLVFLGFRDQVVCKFLVYRQCTCRVEVKYVGVCFSVGSSLYISKQTGVLRTKCCLHIKSRAGHVGKNENCRPFRDRHPCRKLSNRNSNGFIIFSDCLYNLVIRFFILTFIVQLSVSCCKNNLVGFKNRMNAQFFSESAGTGNTVQNPECMLQLISELWRREREFVLPGKCIQKLVYIRIVDKFPCLVCSEEFIQIEGVFFDIVICELNPTPYFVSDNLGHLVSKQREFGQILIRVLCLVRIVPVSLLCLLISICPVIDGIIWEFVICQRFKRSSGKMKRILSADFTECYIRLICVDPFMCLVNDKDVPYKAALWRYLSEFIIQTAEIYRTFQVLQADKLDASFNVIIAIIYFLTVFFPTENILPVFDSIDVADKKISWLWSEKCLVILVPWIGNGRAVRNNKNICGFQPAAKIVCRKSFPKSRLAVP